MTAPTSRPDPAAPRGAADAAPAGHPRRAPRPPVACISSDQLLGGALEVHIEHHGAVYRLKQTSLGKLILTK